MLLTFSFLYHCTLKKSIIFVSVIFGNVILKNRLGHFAMKSADSYSPSFKQAVVLVILLMLLCQSAE